MHLCFLFSVAAGVTPFFTYTSPNDDSQSHYYFGERIGWKFAQMIIARVQSTHLLQQVLLPYVRGHGVQTYARIFRHHQLHYPLYMQEIRGMASGTGLPFDALFVLNLMEEFTHFAQIDARYQRADHCSDLMVCNDAFCGVGHNEDNAEETRNRTYFVEATFGNFTFTGYTYAAELPSGAFGFNQNGIAFSVNYVAPRQFDETGFGRAFISRQLLEARDSDHALSIVQQKHCAGHNYQIMDFKAERIWNVEVAVDKYVVTPVRDPFFHANQYQHLEIDQIISPSSLHRMKRVAELKLPTSPAGILWLLGDQTDRRYPIYHDELSHERGELSNWTIITALFDLREKVIWLFDKNPRGDPSEKIEVPVPFTKSELFI